MPLNSDNLEDARVALGKVKQELAQLKHAGRGSEVELRRLQEENTQLRGQLEDLQKQNAELQRSTRRTRASSDD
jgi:chromosome segregation ATPase